jgi:multicomponent Na+:H+ antiporter subunit C
MPSPQLIYLVTSAAIIGLGVYGLLVASHLLRKLLALNLLGSGVFLLMVTITSASGRVADPVPHALVLTGLVIAVSLTAFALALLNRLAVETGEISLDDPGRRWRCLSTPPCCWSSCPAGGLRRRACCRRAGARCRWCRAAALPLLLLPLTPACMRQGVVEVIMAGHAPPLGIRLRVDALSLLMLWLVALVGGRIGHARAGAAPALGAARARRCGRCGC